MKIIESSVGEVNYNNDTKYQRMQECVGILLNFTNAKSSYSSKNLTPSSFGR